jgi:hypothetical protein
MSAYEIKNASREAKPREFALSSLAIWASLVYGAALVQ